MESLVSALWHGRLCPEERIGENEAYQRASEALCKQERALTALLNEEQKGLLEDYLK